MRAERALVEEECPACGSWHRAAQGRDGSLGWCGHTRTPAKGTPGPRSAAPISALTASTWSGSRNPRARPDWFVTMSRASLPARRRGAARPRRRETDVLRIPRKPSLDETRVPSRLEKRRKGARRRRPGSLKDPRPAPWRICLREMHLSVAGPRAGAASSPSALVDERVRHGAVPGRVDGVDEVAAGRGSSRASRRTGPSADARNFGTSGRRLQRVGRHEDDREVLGTEALRGGDEGRASPRGTARTRWPRSSRRGPALFAATTRARVLRGLEELRRARPRGRGRAQARGARATRRVQAAAATRLRRA